ncbi:MAG: DUF2079 domain-containing protein [Weeksellaceae bacterium]
MKMLSRQLNQAPRLLLCIAIAAYAFYFSLFTISRYQRFYAHYFDLGIMHQTVYNTYKGLETGDLSRVLELTNPHDGDEQVKRMLVHNDILLAFLAPFYFIYPGPETLLVIQSVALALGAYAVYQISVIVLAKVRFHNWVALLFALAYLLYPPMHRTNNYEFHAVALATPLLLYTYYFWLQGKHRAMLICAALALISKEQTGLTVASFAAYGMITQYGKELQQIVTAKKSLFIKGTTKLVNKLFRDKKTQTMRRLGTISFLWVVVSMVLIIPYFRGESHFGSYFYSHLVYNPFSFFTYIFREKTFVYLTQLFSPYGLLPLFSPFHLMIVGLEFLLNILSNNDNMRNMYFHYTAVLHPFIAVAAIYGFRNILLLSQKFIKVQAIQRFIALAVLTFFICSVGYNVYIQSPLPYAKQQDLYPWRELPANYSDIMQWQRILADDQIKVATTGHFAPHFTSRQYYYEITKYTNAEYVIVNPWETQHGYLSYKARPAYRALIKDPNYIKIYDRNEVEVYKRVKN